VRGRRAVGVPAAGRAPDRRRLPVPRAARGAAPVSAHGAADSLVVSLHRLTELSVTGSRSAAIQLSATKPRHEAAAQLCCQHCTVHVCFPSTVRTDALASQFSSGYMSHFNDGLSAALAGVQRAAAVEGVAGPAARRGRRLSRLLLLPQAPHRPGLRLLGARPRLA